MSALISNLNNSLTSRLILPFPDRKRVSINKLHEMAAQTVTSQTIREQIYVLHETKCDIILISVIVILCRPLYATYRLAKYLRKRVFGDFFGAVMKKLSKTGPY